MKIYEKIYEWMKRDPDRTAFWISILLTALVYLMIKVQI